jgi:hypothetical protein
MMRVARHLEQGTRAYETSPLAITAAALLTSSCATIQYGGLTQDQWARLTLCGAGSSQAINASLQYQVAKDIRSGGLTAAVSQEVKTAFLSDANLPASDRETAYEHYLACVNSIQVSVAPHP